MESNVSIPRPVAVGEAIHHGVRSETLVRVEIDLLAACLRIRRQRPEVRRPPRAVPLKTDSLPNKAHAV